MSGSILGDGFLVKNVGVSGRVINSAPVIGRDQNGNPIYGPVQAGDAGDIIYVPSVSLFADGGAGNDLVYTTMSGQNVNSRSGNDLIISGDGGRYTLFGGEGDDTISLGQSGANVDGGPGKDILALKGTRRLNGTTLLETYVPTGSGTLEPGFRLNRASGNINLTGLEELRFLDGGLQLGSASPAAQARRLFNAALGRDADAGGLEFVVGSVQSGTSLQNVAAILLNTAEGIARQGSLTNTDFVIQLFRTALGREPDSGGLNAFVSDLNNGVPRGTVLTNLSESAEGIARATANGLSSPAYVPNGNASSIARLYDSAYGRKPDLGGFTFWVEALNGTPTAAPTISLAAAASSFLNSSEFTARYGNPSDLGFVQLLYQNTLRRAADNGGASYWTNQLASGQSRASVLLAFSESTEHQALLRPFIEDGGVVLA